MKILFAVALGQSIIAWERYDLVIPLRYFEDPRIKALSAVLSDSQFLQLLTAQPGYDVAESGRIQWQTSSEAPEKWNK